MRRAKRLEAVQHVDPNHEAFPSAVYSTVFPPIRARLRALDEKPHSRVSRAGGGTVRFIASVQRDAAERAAFSGFRQQLHVKGC